MITESRKFRESTITETLCTNQEVYFNDTFPQPAITTHYRKDCYQASGHQTNSFHAEVV